MRVLLDQTHYTCMNSATVELSFLLKILYPAPVGSLSCSPQWGLSVLSLSSGSPPGSCPHSLSRWISGVCHRKLRSLSTNSFKFPLKSLFFPYFCPHLFHRFQISWSSVGPHFVKKLPGSCLAIKCPLCPCVYHQSLHSLLGSLPSPYGPSGKIKSVVPTYFSPCWKSAASNIAYCTLFLKLPPSVTSVMTHF